MTVMALAKNVHCPRTAAQNPFYLSFLTEGSQYKSPNVDPQSRQERIKEWAGHLLLLLLTAGAMWFTVTEGWIQLLAIMRAMGAGG